MKTRKMKVFIALAILVSFNFSYLNFANATGGNISFDYSNYNGDQSLKISGGIDAKIDQILVKKFEESDYYNQFRFLKDLSSKVITVSKKSPSKKDLFSELANYLSLKSDLLYKVSKIENNSDVTNIKNIFKTSIKSKGVTLNTVIEKVNATGKVEITNDNDNFSKLSEKDFETEMVKLVDAVKVNKYKSYKEVILENMQPIKTSNDFKKIKNFLPTSVKFPDEFGNNITGEIEGGSFWGYHFKNNDLNTKVNEILSKIGNLSESDFIDIKISGKNKLYDIFEDDNLTIKFLNKISVNMQISKDIEIEEVNLMGIDGILYGYWITPEIYNYKSILKYGNKFDIQPKIDLFLNKDGNLDVYLTLPLKDYIYIGNDKKGEKQYLIFDIDNKKISFGTSYGRTEGNINDKTDANINIVFEDGKKLTTTGGEYNLDDLKKIINKKITRINIDGNDMTSGLLIDKGSIINLYK